MTTDDLKIEKGVPVPSRSPIQSRVNKAMEAMDVGDSFYLESVTTYRAYGFLSNAKRKFKTFSFAVRQNGNGVRIWRTK